MTFRQKTLLRGAVALTALLVTAAAFAAYLRPGMLIEFANVVLCY